MLSDLCRIRADAPDAVAVRTATTRGSWVDTTWAQLSADAMAAARRAGWQAPETPVVLVLDGTAAGIATLLGLLEAGVDIVLLEEQTSHLADPRSAVHLLGADTLIGPPAALTAAGDQFAYRWHYSEYRADTGPAGPHTSRSSRIYQLTSGSTGEPRAARQTLPGVLAGAVAYRDLFEVTADDIVLVTVPLPHSYGLAGTLCALLAGATLMTLSRFSIRSVLAGLDEGASVLLGMPMVYRLLSPVLRTRPAPPRLRIALSAGGPMNAAADAEARAALRVPVRQIYGITEAGLVACVPYAVQDWPAGSVGRAAPGVSLRVEAITDPTDQEPAHAEPGTTGRLLVRGPALFEGYAGSDTPHLTPDGYYDTGDMVRLDPDGFLTVLGRKGAFINVGGRKVSPQRVERLLGQHRAVRDVFVFGMERDDGEQEIQAAVVLNPDTGVDEVLAYCRAGALMPYEVPHHLHVLERMPRTGMGKVDRQEVLAATRQPPTPPAITRQESTR